MKSNKLKITIKIDNSELATDTRDRFWKAITSGSKVASEVSPTHLEDTFKKKFPKELRRYLRDDIRNRLAAFEENYNVDARTYIDKYLQHTYLNKKDDEYSNAFPDGIARLQELKNEYFKTNNHYSELIKKNSFSSQVYFKVDNIIYSSLSFDLSIEPIEKIVDIFDNNFEYFYLFLNAYIPNCFISTISINNPNLLISASIEDSNELKATFEKKENIYEEPQPNIEEVNNEMKPSKAKWVWSLANGTLLIPVFLTLFILYTAFKELKELNNLHKQHYELIEKENDKLIQEYNKLIDAQQKVYDNLVKKDKSNKPVK
jgi:hypothetical protein